MPSRADEPDRAVGAEQERIDPDLLPGRAGPTPTVIAAVAVGGVMGTLLRYWFGRWFPTSGLPVTTIAINVVGALALGVLVVVLDRRPSQLTRALVGVGVLGSLTTFSTFVVDVDRLLDRGDADLALATLVITLAAGLAAALLGMRAAGFMANRATKGVT